MPDTPSASHYAIRITIRATLDRAEAAAWIAELVGTDIASAWIFGLKSAIASLAEQPYRNVVLQRESRLLGKQTRRLIYRRPKKARLIMSFTPFQSRARMVLR